MVGLRPLFDCCGELLSLGCLALLLAVVLRVPFPFPFPLPDPPKEVASVLPLLGIAISVISWPLDEYF